MALKIERTESTSEAVITVVGEVPVNTARMVADSVDRVR